MASNKSWGLIMTRLNKPSNALTARSKHPESKRSEDDSDHNMLEVIEKLTVAITAAQNLEVLLGAIDKQMATYGPYHRGLINMTAFARRLAAAQTDLITSTLDSCR